MHLANFGAFRNSSGKFVFGITDPDEGYLGQYVWDLRRGAVSIDHLDDLTAVPSATYNSIAAAIPGYIQTIAAAKQFTSSYYSVKDVHQRLDSGTSSVGLAVPG